MLLARRSSDKRCPSLPGRSCRDPLMASGEVLLPWPCSGRDDAVAACAAGQPGNSTSTSAAGGFAPSSARGTPQVVGRAGSTLGSPPSRVVTTTYGVPAAPHVVRQVSLAAPPPTATSRVMQLYAAAAAAGEAPTPPSPQQRAPSHGPLAAAGSIRRSFSQGQLRVVPQAPPSSSLQDISLQQRLDETQAQLAQAQVEVKRRDMQLAALQAQLAAQSGRSRSTSRGPARDDASRPDDAPRQELIPQCRGDIGSKELVRLRSAGSDSSQGTPAVPSRPPPEVGPAAAAAPTAGRRRSPRSSPCRTSNGSKAFGNGRSELRPRRGTNGGNFHSRGDGDAPAARKLPTPRVIGVAPGASAVAAALASASAKKGVAPESPKAREKDHDGHVRATSPLPDWLLHSVKAVQMLARRKACQPAPLSNVVCERRPARGHRGDVGEGIASQSPRSLYSPSGPLQRRSNSHEPVSSPGAPTSGRTSASNSMACTPMSTTRSWESGDAASRMRGLGRGPGSFILVGSGATLLPAASSRSSSSSGSPCSRGSVALTQAAFKTTSNEDFEELVARTVRERERVTGYVRGQLQELEDIVSKANQSSTSSTAASAGSHGLTPSTPSIPVLTCEESPALPTASLQYQQQQHQQQAAAINSRFRPLPWPLAVASQAAPQRQDGEQTDCAAGTATAAAAMVRSASGALLHGPNAATGASPGCLTARTQMRCGTSTPAAALGGMAGGYPNLPPGVPPPPAMPPAVVAPMPAATTAAASKTVAGRRDGSPAPTPLRRHQSQPEMPAYNTLVQPPNRGQHQKQQQQPVPAGAGVHKPAKPASSVALGGAARVASAFPGGTATNSNKAAAAVVPLPCPTGSPPLTRSSTSLATLPPSGVRSGTSSAAVPPPPSGSCRAWHAATASAANPAAVAPSQPAQAAAVGRCCVRRMSSMPAATTCHQRPAV